MKKCCRLLPFSCLLVLIAFVLHLSWEIGHSPLYEWNPSIDFYIPFISFVALKDALWSLVFFFVTATILRDHNWPENKKAGYYIMTLCGLVFATAIEIHATSSGRWQYNEWMPVIPLLRVGLTPIIQMSLIPSLAAFIAQRILRAQK